MLSPESIIRKTNSLLWNQRKSNIYSTNQDWSGKSLDNKFFEVWNHSVYTKIVISSDNSVSKCLHKFIKFANPLRRKNKRSSMKRLFSEHVTCWCIHSTFQVFWRVCREKFSVIRFTSATSLIALWLTHANVWAQKFIISLHRHFVELFLST